MEKIGNNLKGIYRDILKEPGRGIVFDSGWNNNTIVDQCRLLLAGLIRQDVPKVTPNQDTSFGVQYLAVGQGDTAWDNGNIPKPKTSTTSLHNAYTPYHTSLDFTYLDELGEPTNDGPTSRLQVSAKLKPGYPPISDGMSTYPLREFGLFGKCGDQIFMINCIRHPVIHKGANATLIRTVRLFF